MLEPVHQPKRLQLQKLSFSVSSLNTFVSRLCKPLLSIWSPGSATHQALVQYHVGRLSHGGQMPSLWPRPQRGRGASLLPGTDQEMFFSNSCKPALSRYKKAVYELWNSSFVVAGDAEVLHRIWNQWPDRKCPDTERDDHHPLWEHHLAAGMHCARTVVEVSSTSGFSCSAALVPVSFLIKL